MDKLDDMLEKLGILAAEGISLTSLVKDQTEAERIYSQARDYYLTGTFEKAIPLFQILVLSYPLEVMYQFGMASSLMQKKEYQRALIVWQLVHLFAPDDYQALLHAAECAFSLADMASGLEFLVKAKKIISLQTEMVDAIIIDRIDALEQRWTLNQENTSCQI